MLIKWLSGFSIIFSILVFSRCANISAPGGGPLDTLKPTLVRSIPKNNETNFNSSVLIFEVSEPIDAGQLAKEIQIQPPLEEEPTIEADRKKIVVKLKKQLRSNTTYNLYFRNGIKDKTEGNILKSNRIRFSTGANLDSIRVEGRIINPLDNKPSTNILVGIFLINDTITPYNTKPEYYNYTNKEGVYTINDIKAGTYKLLAFNDLNKNLLLNLNEPLGFIDTTLSISSNLSLKNLSLTFAKTDSLKISSTKSKNGIFEIRLNKSPRTAVLESKPQLKYLVSANVIRVFPNTRIDSLQVELTVEDSLGTKLKKSITANFDKERFKNKNFISNKNPYRKLTSKGGNVVITTETPIETILKDTILLKPDNNKWVNSKFTLSKNGDSLYIKYPQFQDSLFIKIPAGFCVSALGDTSSQFKDKFEIFKEEDVSLIAGSINTKYKNYIFELLTKDNNVVIRLINPKSYEIPNLSPGEYRIRIIEDLNNNGFWDVGNYRTNIPAEKIYHHPAPIIIKANWELRDVNITTE